MEQLEKTVLANLLAKVENCKLFKERDFSATYFIFPEPKKFFDILWYHYEMHKDILQRDSFESYLRRSTKMTDDYKAKMLVMYEEIKLLPVASNFDVLLDEFKLSFKTTFLGKSLERAGSLLHDKTPDKAIEQIRSDINRLEQQTEVANSESNLFGVGIDIVELYEKRLAHPELFRGIELGFPGMDHVVTHKPGTVTLIMGQMKSAKSVMMINIANNILVRGKKVFYHVNEGGSELVQARLASRISGLNMNKIERCLLTPDEFALFKKVNQDVKNSALLYIDAVPNSMSNCDYLEQKVRDLTEKNGKYEVVLVDYLGLMNTKQHVDSDWKRMGVITLELKDIAMKLNIPIIVIAHVNRKGMEENKKHFDLDEMGVSLEPLKHVDVIMSWRIHDLDLFELINKGQGTLSIRGSRQSGQKSVVLDVDTNIMKIWENLRPITVVASGNTGATY